MGSQGKVGGKGAGGGVAAAPLVEAGPASAGGEEGPAWKRERARERCQTPGVGGGEACPHGTQATRASRGAARGPGGGGGVLPCSFFRARPIRRSAPPPPLKSRAPLSPVYLSAPQRRTAPSWCRRGPGPTVRVRGWVRVGCEGEGGGGAGRARRGRCFFFFCPQLSRARRRSPASLTSLPFAPPPLPDRRLPVAGSAAGVGCWATRRPRVTGGAMGGPGVGADGGRETERGEREGPPSESRL